MNTVMFYKLAALILIATVTAMALLVLRHHRYQTMHDMTQLHQALAQMRQRVWNQQSAIANHLDPQNLRKTLKQTTLAFEDRVGGERAQPSAHFSVQTAQRISSRP